MSESPRYDVVVVGAGPVGAAFALDLARRGVDVLAIDPDAELAFDGRARTVSVRSMEHLRSWGVADELREASPIPRSWYNGTSYRTSIGGRELWRERTRADLEALSHERVLRLPQNRTTRILRDAAARAGATFAIGLRATSFSEHASGARIEVEDRDGRTSAVEASYVVAADGSRSQIRRAAGIAREATELQGIQYSVIVEVPGVFEATGTVPNAYNWIFNDTLSDAFNPFEPDRYGLSIGPFTEPTVLSDERISDEVARRVGRRLPHRTVSITDYRLQKRIATTFRRGRLLLAGDAAHSFPPSLGMNLNTGLADAGNGAWKLAAVIRGWGQHGLLDSYDAERRAAAHRIGDATLEARAALDRRLAYLAGRVIPEGDSESETRERNTIVEAIRAIRPPSTGSIGASLDDRYDHARVIVPDATPAPPWYAGEYHPIWRPGHRVPHLVLRDGSSLHHRFGSGFTLLVADPASAGEALSLAARADDLGIPLDVVDVSSLLPAASGDAPPPRHPLSLVRPDQILAWHGSTPDADASVLLLRVSGAATHVCAP